MYDFEVKAMSCGHCIKKVTQAIQRQDPSAKVSIDLATKRVKIESHSEEALLRRALEDADYPVS